MRNILFQYGLDEKNCIIEPLGNGLINTTWLVNTGTEQYVLQKVNQDIFKEPADIAFNTRLIAGHLNEHHPEYLFIAPVKTVDGMDLVKTPEGYFRMFPFVKNSHTIDVAETPEQAYEAAKQFGKFTRLLSGLDATQLKITLPDFHNLTLRYREFRDGLQDANMERIEQSRELIEFIDRNKNIVDEFWISKTKLKIRCTHHDTKISNVLFDENGKGLCVIDLDTVMPGYFISDVGDMMRTYLSPANEEEKDISKIEVRAAFYDAIVAGYSSEMGEELSEAEKEYFHFAGKFMIYMQAIRFLADHINNDIYYGAKYEGHNFFRARNQITLLQRLIEFTPG